MKNREKKLEENKFQKFLDFAGAIIVVVDADQRISYINKIGCQALGYNKKDVIGTNWFDYFIPEIIRNKIKSIFDEVMTGKIEPIEYFENSIITKKGQERIIEWHNTILKNNQGRIYATLSSGHDITERKIAEQKLKESEEKYRNILESIKEVYYEVDKYGNFTFLTDKFVELVGYPKNELLGFNYKKIVSIEDLERVYTILDNMYKKDIQEMLFEYTLVKKDGSKRFFENSVYLKYDSEGKKIGFYGLARDISEREKVEQKLKESEVKYRQLVELLPDLVAEVNTKLELTYANSIAFELFGYSQEDFNKGLKVIQMIAPEDLVKASKNMKKVFNGEIIGPIDYLLLKKDGTKFYGRINSRPIYKEGRITGLRCVISDVTERKKVEQKIKESEEKYRRLINNISDLIIEEGLNSKILYLSPQVFEILGYQPQEIIGSRLINYVHPEDSAKFMDRAREIVTTGTTEIFNYRLRHKNGHYINVAAKGGLYKIEGKTRYIGVMRDITEQIETGQKLKESEAKYRDAYNLVSFYKDVFTHDMNNILQNILTSVELLSLFTNNPEKSEENKEILQILKSQVKRSANLILNVRKLTKLEETQIGIRSTEAINVLRKTIEFIKKSVQDREILIEVDTNFEKVFIQANELLVDIFENILLNSVKYNDNTQVEIIIIISKIQKEGIKYLKIEFKDNGIGVTDVAKDIIFKGGYKRDKKFRGMGLGLSLVKKILENYNGEIWVEDRVPGDYTKGSNFVILIPETV